MAHIIQNNPQTIGTGDINLAAACMTLGCPPANPPVKLIAHQNGNDYTRFLLLPSSIEGHLTMLLMDAWSNSQAFVRDNPTHPMTKIMNFSMARPNGCVSFTDWTEHAGAWLGIGVDAAKKLIKDIAGLCAREPESEAAYILAFIRNRFDLVDIAKRYQKTGFIEAFQTHGKSIMLISENLPKAKREYLFQRL